MIEQIKYTLYNACCADKNSKILLAVSGGADSVALCYIFKQLNINFALAHCNFKLRAKDSDEDALFVAQLAKNVEVPFFSIDFDTEEYVAQHKVSIQVAARNLRYEWLENTRKQNNFQFIATAHHANDQAETILMHLIKGTGLDGLAGMKFKNNYLIRPMLTVTKQAILDFVAQKNIAFREDSSNASDKYTRNNIRLNMLPLAEAINPNFYQEMVGFGQKISEIQAIYKQGLEQITQKLIKSKGDDFYISIILLEKQAARNTILFEILRNFNFTTKQIAEVPLLLHSEAGKQINSTTHRLLKDRKHLIITPLCAIDTSTVHLIKTHREKISLADFVLDVNIKNAKKYQPEYRPKVAVLDLEKVVFPLTLRKWKEGDYFYPYGMSKPKSEKIGKKKLKKFFTDLKLSVRDKECIWIVQDAQNRIVWVVGLRIDARFQIQETTQKILRLRLTHVVDL